MADEKICPKCQRPMTKVDTWLGLPALFDDKFPRPGGEKVNVRNAVPVVAYFCQGGCKYLELYAE